MQIDVGNVLSLQGRKWLVSEIQRTNEKFIARDWHVERYSGGIPVNTPRQLYLKPETCVFTEGDVIEREHERVWLHSYPEAGDFLALHTIWKVRKIERVRHQDVESGSPERTASGEAEGSREGDPDRGSVGETATG